MLRTPRGLDARALALVIASAAGLGAAGAPRSAHAQSTSEIAAAKAWFAEGIQLENAAKWKEALERFRRAQAVKRTPAIDFHVGLCEARTGDLVSALVDLDRAAVSARDKHASDVESAATAELVDARKRVPTLEIDAPADRVQRVLLDGAPFGTATLGAPVPVNPGEHAVVVEFASGRAEKKVTLAEREAKKLAFEPPQAAPPIAVVPVPAPVAMNEPATAPAGDATSSSPSSSSHPLPWILVAGGGAMIAGGVVFWVMRGSELSTLDDACPSRTHCDPALQSHADSGKTDATLAVALGGAGLAAAAIGAGMLLFSAPRSSREASAVLVPTALPGGAGATVVGRF